MAKYRFSVDLVEEAKKHIVFLRALHRHGITTNNDISSSIESFRRYSQLWLPFVHKHYCHSDDNAPDLIPPADIAWLWHCHRLAPYRYAQYIKNEFFHGDGDKKDSSLKVLDPSHPFVFQLENNASNDTFSSTEADTKIAQRTMELFAEMYPDESFFFDHNNINNDAAAAADTKLGGFDVIESCERQATFLWQVSGPSFHDDKFLQQGVANYSRFVQLMGQKSKPRYLVPTYQIDLMWHTHMLASVALYHNDNMKINGCTLEHDDSLNDRTKGGKLDTNFQETRKLWKQVYGCEYKVPGGMYRGEPPLDYFDPEWITKQALGLVGASDTSHISLALAHLIGQVGASSHGRAVWMSIDHEEAFLPANPKSTVRGANANPQKTGYIFGRGGVYLFVLH